MKQQVLKALANPARIFYVPYNLAILNFVVQFILFMTVFIVDLSIRGVNANSNLMLVFMGSVFFVHMILVFFSKREPQIMQMLLAKINMFRKRASKTLRV